MCFESVSFPFSKLTQEFATRSVCVGNASLHTHLIYIRLPLLKAELLIECVGLNARGVRGEAKVDGREFASGGVDDSLQEGAADPLAPIGRQDHDILDTRLPPGRRLKDTQGGASDNPLGIVLCDENPRPRRSYRAPLLRRSDRQLGIQLFHKSQQISDLGVSQSTKFKKSHSIWKTGFRARWKFRSKVTLVLDTESKNKNTEKTPAF